MAKENSRKENSLFRVFLTKFSMFGAYLKNFKDEFKVRTKYLRDKLASRQLMLKSGREFQGTVTRTSDDKEEEKELYFLLAITPAIWFFLFYLLCKLGIFCIFGAKHSITTISPSRQVLILQDENLSISDGNTVDLSFLKDVYKAGPGLKLNNNVFSLEKVNGDVGTFGGVGNIPVFTVDEYGRVIAAGNVPFKEFVVPPECGEDFKLIWNGSSFECLQDRDTLGSLACSSDEVPMFIGGEWICQRIDHTRIYDEDEDTEVYVDFNGEDRDQIRFKSAGVENAMLDQTGNLLLSQQTSLMDSLDDFDANVAGLYFNNERNALRIGVSDDSSWDRLNLGEYTFSLGRNNLLVAPYSFGLGENIESHGGYSLGVGEGLILNSEFGTAFGRENRVSGIFALALGNNNRAEGDYSVVGGQNSVSQGRFSVAFGESVTSASYGELVIGRYNVGGGNPNFWDPDDPIFEIGNGTSIFRRNNAFTVLKKGYVGIGTNSPQYPLEVAHDRYPWVVSINLSNGAFAAYQAFQGANNTHPRAMFSIGNRYLGNSISTAGIWITPEVGPNYHKHVFFELMTNSNIRDYNTKRLLVMQRTTFAEIQSRSYIGNGPGVDLIIWTRPNNYQLFLAQRTGNVGVRTNRPSQTFQVGNSGDGTSAVANAWNTFSDIRFKTNIETIANSREILKRLRGVRFRWKSTGKESIGFIAQEVEPVLPEIVTRGSDGYLSVDYSRVVPLLVEGFKELDVSVTDLDKFTSNFAETTETKFRDVESVSARLERELRDIKTKLDKFIKGYTFARLKVLETLEVGHLEAESIELHDSRLAGEVVIPAGKTSVRIVFDKPFQYIPIVVASPKDFVVYRLDDISEQGFTIYIKEPRQTNVRFTWIIQPVSSPSRDSSANRNLSDPSEEKLEKGDKNSEKESADDSPGSKNTEGDQHCEGLGGDSNQVEGK